MSKLNIQQKLSKFKKHVTHFSEQLKYQVVQEQEVIVGGTILNIVPPVDEEFPMYIVILDDLVGQTHVFVTEEIMNTFMDQFQIGQDVFIEGFVNIISRRIQGKEKRDVSVFAYDVKDFRKNGDNIS